MIKEYGPVSDGNTDSDVRMTIQFGYTSPQPVVQSYRVYRQAWHATPASVPDVVADNGNVWMSWNGATDVTKWAVYAGPSETGLRKVGTVDKRGFESSFGLKGNASWVQVAALQDGEVVRKSRVVRVG